MPTLATWGTFNFDDSEITSFSWSVPTTEYIQVPKVTGYPSVQQVGDTLGSCSIGLRFGGSTAIARVNALRTFAISAIELLQLGATSMGFFYQKSLTINYELLASNNLVIIAATLELEQDP